VGEDESEIARRAEAIGRKVDELRENGVCGTPSEAAERLEQWREAGAERVYLQVLDHDDLDHIELLGRDVRRAV
jgi:alkanesulfonate monooxygenase SsuD/methylene tetrahydromethanopterin reductase-like flavin-dependent oxidoreductase (luciferase family)